MHKSQLRLLARRYADLAIERSDYVGERQALIDSIVSGETRITRVAPAPPPPPPTPEQLAAHAEVMEDDPPSKLPFAIAGGVAVVVVILGAWLLWPIAVLFARETRTLAAHREILNSHVSA